MVLLMSLDEREERFLPKGRFRSFEDALNSLKRFGKIGDIVKGQVDIAVKTSKGVYYAKSLRAAHECLRQVEAQKPKSQKEKREDEAIKSLMSGKKLTVSSI